MRDVERKRAFANVPEVPLIAAGLILNFGWEMLQMPLFVDMQPTSRSALICLRASAGDAPILVAAFWLIAWFSAGRRWIARPKANRIALFTVVAFVIAMMIEAIATKGLHRYSYNDRMPIIPVLSLGLTPFMQWVVLPPAVIGLAAWYLGRRM